MEPTSKHRSSFWDTIKEAFSGRRKLWILLILVLGFLAWRGLPSGNASGSNPGQGFRLARVTRFH